MSKRRNINPGILKEVEVSFYPVDPGFIARLPRQLLKSIIHTSLSKKRRFPEEKAIPISPEGSCIGWAVVTKKRPKHGVYPIIPTLVNLKVRVSNFNMEYKPREIKATWYDHHKGVFLYLKSIIEGAFHESQKLVILHGPPGSGKTHMVNQVSYIAYKKGWNIYRPPRSALLSPYISESANNISSVFEKAVSETDAKTKGLIVFDELETLAARRQDFHSHSLLSVLETVNTLCLEIDNLVSNGNVWVFATTNLMNLIDEALISRATVLSLDLPSKQAIKKLVHDLSKSEKEEEKVLLLLREIENPSYRDVNKAFEILKLEKTIGCNPFKSKQKESPERYIR